MPKVLGPARPAAATSESGAYAPQLGPKGPRSPVAARWLGWYVGLGLGSRVRLRKAAGLSDAPLGPAPLGFCGLSPLRRPEPLAGSSAGLSRRPELLA